MGGRRNGRSSKWKVVVMEGRDCLSFMSRHWRTSLPCCYENNLVPKTIMVWPIFNGWSSFFLLLACKKSFVWGLALKNGWIEPQLTVNVGLYAIS